MMDMSGLSKMKKIRPYVTAVISGLIIAVNIFCPTAISLIIAILFFWVFFLKEDFFINISKKSSRDIEQSFKERGGVLCWGIPYLLCGVPLYIFYIHPVPTGEIINECKFVISLILFIVIIMVIYIIYMQKYSFIKKKMYKACIIIACWLVGYFGLVFCEMNYFIDNQKAYVVVDVEEITGFKWSTNFFYTDEDGNRRRVSTFKIVPEDYEKIILHEDEGVFGVSYRNVYYKGVE